MEALILAWTTAGPQWSGSYASATATVRTSGVVRHPWTVAIDERVEIGTDAWLLVVDGGPLMRGVVGHGEITAVSSGQGRHQDLAIEFDALLPHGDQLPLARLEAFLPGIRQQTEARPLDGPAAATLRSLWSETVAPLRGSRHPVPGSLPARMVTRVPANSAEHDPDLRSLALAHRGSLCHACDVDLEQAYGDAGRDLMEVHHITPLEYLDSYYEVDPLTDLVPLCPTCHAVAHSGRPVPLRVEDIRRMLGSGGFLRGTIMTEEQLAAEAAAAQLRDPT
ncbi:hypothetical protein FJV46_12135 [Arthrobacter agilis]|uniref:HNH endonuclease n=1 Tax=Arthrobacter agilis TaxID=37921 RepID=UPI000B360829|nr:hypothetical protein [Arthrobacter agilis]OUM45022.1 hypothetical protein B8W74_01910 [Arthrobacter agilis]PPB46914.1 hypothetical protein CI784_04270 [Arthrobacter agilis]TPV23493.1 hypothetical protein FJV46_12135 [Arthrobacter agilis]VDR31889.1 Predicted restriction endonuclease [Arthrobacter agilis]